MSPTKYYFGLDQSAKPAPFTIPEKRVKDWVWYDQNRARSRGSHPINAVTTIVIHATAGWATQHALDRWKIVKASAHWIVPDEDEPQHKNFVWAVVSESLAAYHVKDSKTHSDLGNKKRVNNYSVGIEIVNTQDVQNYKDPYSEWQIRMAALITRYCWAKYPNFRHVISHARIDPTNRSDPGSNFPWDDFKELVHDDTVGYVDISANLDLKPISSFPYLDAAAGGGCCP